VNSGSPGAFAAQLSWPEVERRVKAGAVAVLPVGAACKEHGPHLPMNTDFLQAEWLAGALVQRAEVLVWPTVTYGYYPAFTDYPGSVSLTRETFQHMVQEILSEIRRAGVRAVLILNTGISTIEPVKAAVGDMPEAMRIELANVYSGPRCCSVTEALEEQTRGGHADELETSILLAIGREHVALGKAQTWIPPAVAVSGPFSRSDPDNPRFSPSGVWGDPTLASEEKGRRLLAAMVDDLFAAVEALQGEQKAAPRPDGAGGGDL
jgi:creatinine amidohydrolase/Fe(II)-dependent formamide hydrolase-like protein